MILVDTSIWIDHLHRPEPELVRLLGEDEVGHHPLVIEELALGHIVDRSRFIALVAVLTCFPSSPTARSFGSSTRTDCGGGVSARSTHTHLPQRGCVAVADSGPGTRGWTELQKTSGSQRFLIREA